MYDLQTFWFVTLGVLLAGYAVLDGFDFGVGILHLFARGDHDRRIVLNSIGPLWDGNEVWLVTFGGALFAAFPNAYATLLSGFYLPFMALLVCLIGRAISIEFRSKVRSPGWRSYWDVSFFLSSTLAVFIMGVAVGNALAGVPLDARGEFAGDWTTPFSPFSLSVGVFAVATCAMHGAIYLHLKTEGALQQRVRRWMWRSFAAFALAYVGVTAMTLLTLPQALGNFERFPLAWGVVALNVLAVANVPRALHRDRPGMAFVSSAAVIVAATFLLGMALYPNLLLSTGPGPSLTIYNAASSERTLAIMRTIAVLGMPFVITYSAVVYWVFRGKVKLDKSSY